LIDEETYLKLIAKTINAVQRGSGRKKQSLADSSFDAWTKYYRQDENSPNAIVSYYAKGSLVALGLDLSIRAETQGKKSLDDVMRALWKKFGKDFYAKAPFGKQQGLGEQEFAELVEQVSGVNIKRFIDRYVHGTDDVPLAKWYADVGVEWEDAHEVKKASQKASQNASQNASQKASPKASFNVRLAKSGADCKLAHVYEQGAAHRAGLSAGDILVAINGLRVTAADTANGLSNLLNAYRIGETLQVHVFRRDELLSVQLKLQADDAPAISLRLASNQKIAGAKRRPSA
jgi:predicted metalloprotease with PDZ domain